MFIELSNRRDKDIVFTNNGTDSILKTCFNIYKKHMKNKQSSRPINSKDNYNKVDIVKQYLQIRISASTIYIHFCGNMLKALGVS